MGSYLLLIILTIVSLAIILSNISNHQRLYLTETSIQVMSISGRTCIPLIEVRELLYKVQPNHRPEYLIKTVNNIYYLGSLTHCPDKHQNLAQIAQKTNLQWESIYKYFPEKPSDKFPITKNIISGIMSLIPFV